ncbi:unnamed protein product [Arabidopsis halleri]
MTMCLFSPLLMTIFGSVTTRYRYLISHNESDKIARDYIITLILSLEILETLEILSLAVSKPTGKKKTSSQHIESVS